MDFKKIFEVAKMPMIALIVLGVLGYAFAFLGTIGAMLNLLLSVVSLAVILYAGYIATKKHKLDLLGAGMVALVAGLVSGIVGSILLIILMFAGFSSVLLGTEQAALMATLDAGTIAITLLIGSVIGLIFGAVIDFVLGLIGGLVGKKF